MSAARATALGLVCALAMAAPAHADLFPSVVVRPGPYKPMDVFHQDQSDCRDYAGQVVRGDDNAGGEVIGGAVVGAALGAILGSAVDRRHGAAPGAVGGALAGVALGADAASRDHARAQRQYDDAFERCMYAHDDLLPGQDPDAAPPPPPPPR